MRKRATQPSQYNRGVFDARITELCPVVSTIVETGNLPPALSNHMSGGPLWTLVYFFSPCRVKPDVTKNRWLDYCPGSAALFPPGPRYQLDTRPARGLSRHAWALFDGLDKSHALPAPGQWGRHIRFADPDAVLGNYMIAFARLAEEHKDDPFWIMQVHGLRIVKMLVTAEPAPGGFFRIGANDAAPMPHPVVARTIAYLRENISERITLAALARHLRLSESAVSHYYRRAAGESPMQTLRRMRILQAKVMLIRGHMVRDTAAQLGFYDEHHFSQAFKAAEGVSPQVFRDRNSRTLL